MDWKNNMQGVIQPTIPLLLVLVLYGCAEHPGAVVKPESDPPIPVQVKTAAIEEVSEYRRLTGDVLPLDVLPLSFKVGGRIDRLLIEEGDQVKKGQLVAIMDPQDYQLTHDLAAAQVNALSPHLKRAEQLHDNDALPQAQLDELQSRMNAAQIQRSQAQAQLSYAKLKAPISGIVLKRMVAVGDMVGPSRPIAVLAQLRTVNVVLPVSQRDLHLFANGMKIELTAEGIHAPIIGEVSRISYTADEKTRTFSVVLKADNRDLIMRAGMIVETRIPVARHKGIFIPLDAVQRDAAGQPQVLVMDRSGNRAAGRSIRIGTLIADTVQVTAGLKEGEEVIIRGMARAGNPVVVVDSAVAKSKTADEQAPGQ